MGNKLWEVYFFMKTCRKCNVEKPLTTEYFQARKSGKDGFRNECKDCQKSYRKQYYERNKERIIKHNLEYRKKNWEQFTANRKLYEERNKERLAECRKQYYQKNKNEISRKKKIYMRENKEYFSQYYLEWARNNPDKCKAKRHRREAKLRKLPYNYTEKDWERTVAYFKTACAYCGEEKSLEHEHFIPLSKGGEYTINNIIPACASCNSSKQDSDFFDWYPKHESYSQAREKKILQYLNYESNKTQQLSIL